MSHIDGFLAYWHSNPTEFENKVRVNIFFHIKQDGKEIIVKGDDATMPLFNTPLIYLYYPNSNAYKVTIVFWDTKKPVVYEFPLEKHGFLNGAFFFDGWNESDFREGIDMSSLKGFSTSAPPTSSSREQRTIELPNKIYTSEVNNPFHFPVLGINTVGTGTVLGICAAVKALSQGQFGQFPLYAFTTEGVWALEVSSTGSYSARQPVTRDVCINADGITQIDTAVLFPTNRGIMLLSGSNSMCITDTINTDYPFDINKLPQMEKILKDSGIFSPSLMPFTDFLRDCRMVYDYTNQRVIVYRPDVTYAYVYSLKSKMWGMMQNDVSEGVNSYPEALAMNRKGELVNFSTPKATDVPSLLITRPLKIDLPNILKTVNTVIQRGDFQKGHVQTILYGSRDLQAWHLIWSSTDHYLRGFRGTPYKYYRIALKCNLKPDERIYSCSIQFDPRHNNQPR